MRWIYSSIQTWNRWNKKLRWLLRKFWIPNVVPKTWTFLRVLISPSNTQNFGVSAYLIRHIGILPVHQQTFTTTRWDLHHAMTYELLESILLQSYFQKLSACSRDWLHIHCGESGSNGDRHSGVWWRFEWRSYSLGFAWKRCFCRCKSPTKLGCFDFFPIFSVTVSTYKVVLLIEGHLGFTRSLSNHPWNRPRCCGICMGTASNCCSGEFQAFFIFVEEMI